MADRPMPVGMMERLLESGDLHKLAVGCETEGGLARKLGISLNALQKARRRWRRNGRHLPTLDELLGREWRLPGDFETEEDTQESVTTVEDAHEAAPDGFAVRGVSTLYGSDGSVKAQWVKTRREEQDRMDALMEALATLPIKGEAEPIESPSVSNDDLLAFFPMGDPHLGMFSWSEETGQDFDLGIAEHNLCAAVDHLVALAPPAKHALIANLGDFFHTDNSSNQTMRSHNALDVDTRWSKVLRVGIRAMRRCIDRALEKHEHVTVINEIGNHDDHSSIFLALALQQFYEREPRVHIDTSPAKFHWYRFGECLIMITHSDTVKMEKLPLVMAHDRREDWGQTQHHYVHVGHGHHDNVKEIGGVLVEMHGTLAPADAWATAAGYRARQTMKCIVYDREHGEINRHTVGIRQLR